MKHLRAIIFLSIVLSALGVGSLYAQSDTIVISPAHGTSDPCGFHMTVKNRNSANAAIFKIKLELLSADGTGFGDPAVPYVPTGWVAGLDQNSTVIDSFQAQVNGIAPGATLSGFKFAYFNDGTHEYDAPKTIKWTTYDNADNQLSTGQIAPTCVPFQFFSTYDTATVFTDLSGCDPMFHFTVGNRNDLARPIGYMRFQLVTPTSGTLRPAKCTAPSDWVLDSVTAYSAYYHTDNNAIETGNGKGIFNVGLRGNTNVTKHSFAWWASDDQNFFIDRDTIFNIPIQATCVTSDNDSITADAGTNGCLYTMTVRNWHVSNLIAPGPITKIVLKSQTPGVHFDGAPNAPAKWTKTVTADSIVYAADSVKRGIPGGIISTQFSYSVTGSTTTPFTIGWQTYRPQGLISSGSYSSTCQVQQPRGDSLKVDAGANECDFVAHVINLHNTPASNIGSISLSIPSGSGQLIGVASSSGWNIASVSPTELKYSEAGTPQTTGSTQDLTFTLKPKTAGQPVTLTCKTNDESSTQVWTGTADITCSPAPTPCDTVTEALIAPIDSCYHSFTVASRGGADITSITFAPNPTAWKVDSILATPTGWTSSIDANGVATFTSTSGILSNESLGGFNLKFQGNDTPDNFTVTVTSTDRNNHACTNSIALTCSSLAVPLTPEADARLANISLVPNPSRASSVLTFTVNSQERVFVTVYDELGKTVKVATNQVYTLGSYSVPLELGSQPAGNYYVRIQTPYGIVTKRLIKE